MKYSRARRGAKPKTRPVGEIESAVQVLVKTQDEIDGMLGSGEITKRQHTTMTKTIRSTMNVLNWCLGYSVDWTNDTPTADRIFEIVSGLDIFKELGIDEPDD